MSLQLHKKLADLHSETREYAFNRRDIMEEKYKLMEESVPQEVIGFFESEDFEVCRKGAGGFHRFSYKDIIIDIGLFTKKDEGPVAISRSYPLHYDGIEYKLTATLKLESLPIHVGQLENPKANLEEDIAYYEELLPRMKTVGVDDITGEYYFSLDTERVPRRGRKLTSSEVRMLKGDKLKGHQTVSELFNAFFKCW